MSALLNGVAHLKQIWELSRARWILCWTLEIAHSAWISSRMLGSVRTVRARVGRAWHSGDSWVVRQFIRWIPSFD